MKILIINGPNLNMLGIREPDIYGRKTYDELIGMIRESAAGLGVDVEFYQSNHEGDLVDKIQEAYFRHFDGIVINPGAYTHYSYAIRDALASVTMPKIEIHISDILQREEFRHHSVTAEVCDEQIKGLGLEGYIVAIEHMMKLLENPEAG